MKKNIKIQVELDENMIPNKIEWDGDDVDTNQSTNVCFLRFWDKEKKSVMHLDLWTKTIEIEEMKHFFLQTLETMATSFEKATGETLIMEDLRDYCIHFADKMNIKK